jgi:hypothetical protein
MQCSHQDFLSNNLRLYTSLAHTPTPPASWLRLCLYAPVGAPASAVNFTPCASGPQAEAEKDAEISSLKNLYEKEKQIVARIWEFLPPETSCTQHVSSGGGGLRAPLG